MLLCPLYQCISDKPLTDAIAAALGTTPILPIASSCCTAVSHHVPRRLLDRVHTCRIQRADGDCDLAAVILHVRHRRICASPHSHTVKQWMKKQAAKKHANGHACHTKKHHGKRHSHGAHPARPGTRPPSSVLESEPATL
ncbi:C-C motif chemokine 28 isoform X1 [Myotis lucifugus]|uniref:C-C motif chemokine 28 isoform X1 n=1 Tax=Myotis lucifugus TaxID=59463 RepID=UPI0006D7319E|nr:C-C motif chemokine 28 isoform X1 [Myotis lucifugus]